MTPLKKNYRYKHICKKCGRFISKDKEHKCLQEKRKVGNKFKCGVCGAYKIKKDFPKDRTHKYHINNRCKECRSKQGWGNNKRYIIKMMSEKQLRERIYLLEKEIRFIDEILNVNNPDDMGRPKGSIKYTPEQVKFLIENKQMHMKNLIPFYNRTFGTDLKPDSRALYNFMCREGILEWREDWRRER